MIFLPTEKIQKEYTAVEVAMELGGWAFAGVAVHSLAQGLQHKPIMTRILE
jgi:hypothetical protein